jgi:predicted nucleotidyltransferase
MREIGRMLGKKPGVFQRTLNNMVIEGILKSEYRANAKYFWVDKQHALYRELKNIVFKTSGVQGSLQNALKELRNIRFAFIYGSFSKGKEHSTSDIDLMIIGECKEPALIKRLDDLEKRLNREINYHLYSVRKFEAEIRKNNAFLKEILKDKKIMVVGEEDELREIYQDTAVPTLSFKFYVT